MDAAAFLHSLYGAEAPGQLLIWRLQSKQSYWTRNTAEAAHYAVTHAQTEDVYVGVGLAPPNASYGRQQRVRSEYVYGIPGLVADVDIADPVHKKPNLPPDDRAAQGLLYEMPLPPSLIIHSGHGLQAWWLFEQPLLFEHDAKRVWTQELLQNWNHELKSLASERGWDVDAVFDLARVMRIPGTWNHKGDEAVPVEAVLDSDWRYDPAAVRGAVRAFGATQSGEPVSTPTAAQTGASTGNLTLNAGAQPPGDKFLALQEAEPRFYASWERKRKDLQDQSASAYDFSLASFASQAGWTNQEIVDLLIASRRKHGDDLKLREDYYRRTLEKAGAHNHVAALENGHVDETTLESLSSLWLERSKIVRFVRYTGEPAQYGLETDKGKVLFTSAWKLSHQQGFLDALMSVTNEVPRRVKDPEWRQRLQALLDCAEDEDIGAESTIKGQAQTWIEHYLSRRDQIHESIEDAELNRWPFREDGQLYIFGGDFRGWLFTQGEKISTKETGIALRSIGAEPVIRNVRLKDGTRSTRSVWRIPG